MLKREQIGGAYVRRTFSLGGERVNPASPPIPREVLLGLPKANLNALIANGYLDPYPLGPDGQAPVAPITVIKPVKRFVAKSGKGFDVFEGEKLNADPLTKEQAETLAGVSADTSGTN